MRGDVDGKVRREYRSLDGLYLAGLADTALEWMEQAEADSVAQEMGAGFTVEEVTDRAIACADDLAAPEVLDRLRPALCFEADLKRSSC